MGLGTVLRLGAGQGGGMPALVLAGALVAAAGSAVPGRAVAQQALVEQSPVQQAFVQTAFDVPAGPLSRALTTFGRQAGLQVTYLTVVSAGKNSPGVSGQVGPEDALTHILQGTGLSYSFTNATTVAVSAPAGGARAGHALVSDAVPVAVAIQVAFAVWAFRAPAGAGGAWRGNR